MMYIVENEGHVQFKVINQALKSTMKLALV